MPTSLTSKKQPSEAQVRRVRTLTEEAVESVLEEKDTFTADQLQAVHSNGGLYKQEFAAIFWAFVLSFSRRQLAVVRPLRAQQTGLIPAGWTVEKDELEGDINITKLDFSYCPVVKVAKVDGSAILREAAEQDVIGSLGFAKVVLDAQKEGKDIIPTELRGKIDIILPRTVLRDACTNCRVPSLVWDGGQWLLTFFFLLGDFGAGRRTIRRLRG